MDNSIFKLIGTLFGIGAAVSFARSLKSKKNWREIVSEMIITGFMSVGAATIYIVFPDVNIAAVMGLAAVLAVLGIAFFSAKIEKALDMATEKWLKKDGD